MVKLVRTSKRHRWNNFTLCNTDQGCRKLYYTKKFRDLKSFFVLGGSIVHTSDGASASAEGEENMTRFHYRHLKRKRKRKRRRMQGNKTLRFLAFSLALAFAIVFHTCEPFQCKRNQTRKVRKVCTPCWNAETRTKLAFVLDVWTFLLLCVPPALMGQYHDIWRNPELCLQHQNHLKIIVKSA